MSRLSRKFVAILMLLWLPLFSASSLAASVAMQMPQGHCMEMADMDGMDMSGYPQHQDEAPAMADEKNSSCSSCGSGICHLACTAYLAVPGVALSAVQTGAQQTVPYLVSFRSITSTLLLPPPLVRA